MRKREIFVWILVLSYVSVGLRNFEVGLSSDAPFYSTVSRNIVKSGDWIKMSTSVPGFDPYYVEHPHLGYWVIATVFKVFGADDWVARIPGHFFYVLFLFIYFLWIRNRFSEKTAFWSVIVLWSFYKFSNYFSNVYLDPGCLFFGFASLVLFEKALEESKYELSLLGGVSLALCTMYKGLTVIGFLPVFLVPLLLNKRIFVEKGIQTLMLLLGALIPLFAYISLVLNSNAPQFFEIYWDHQMTNRFAQAWSFSGLVEPKFWKELFFDSYGLVLLTPYVLSRVVKQKKYWLPLALFSSFCVMYAVTFRKGTQYWLMLLPWIALFAADLLFNKIRWEIPSAKKASMTLAIVVVFVAQWLPFRVHGLKAPEEMAVLKEYSKEPVIILATDEIEMNFLGAGRFAWYTERSVEYIKTPRTFLPSQEGRRLVMYLKSMGVEELTVQGFCKKQEYSKTEVWLPCSSLKTTPLG